MSRKSLIGLTLVLLVSVALVGCKDPIVGVTPTTLFLDSQTKGAEFQVYNDGKGTLEFTITKAASDDWYTLSKTSGTSTGADNKVTIALTLTSTGLKALQNGTGVITVTGKDAKGDPGKIAVTKQPNYMTQDLTNPQLQTLTGRTLTFTPADSLSMYTSAVSEADVLPTPVDPEALPLDFTVENPVPYPIEEVQVVPFYGVDYNVLYVGSGGLVNFVENAGSSVANLEEHFEFPRVTALSSVDAVDYGDVTVQQDADKVAVTYMEVPDADGISGTNTFQVGLFFNGIIQLTYLTLTTPGGIIGLSDGGGLPDGFIPSDLTTDYNTGAL